MFHRENVPAPVITVRGNHIPDDHIFAKIVHGDRNLTRCSGLVMINFQNLAVRRDERPCSHIVQNVFLTIGLGVNRYGTIRIGLVPGNNKITVPVGSNRRRIIRRIRGRLLQNLIPRNLIKIRFIDNHLAGIVIDSERTRVLKRKRGIERNNRKCDCVTGAVIILSFAVKSVSGIIMDITLTGQGVSAILQLITFLEGYDRLPAVCSISKSPFRNIAADRVRRQ